MSQELRDALVASPNTIFQNPSERADLLDEAKTSTYLIELLYDICVTKNWAVEFTAIRSDHHDDSSLGEAPQYIGTHWGGENGPGWAADLWPLNTPTAGDYIDASDPKFQQFLEACGVEPERMQTGLAGSAYTHADVVAAGSGVFQDAGADHVHLSAKPL
jgi:hypothetical protein